MCSIRIIRIAPAELPLNIKMKRDETFRCDCKWIFRARARAVWPRHRARRAIAMRARGGCRPRQQQQSKIKKKSGFSRRRDCKKEKTVLLRCHTTMQISFRFLHGFLLCAIAANAYGQIIIICRYLARHGNAADEMNEDARRLQRFRRFCASFRPGRPCVTHACANLRLVLLTIFSHNM